MTARQSSKHSGRTEGFVDAILAAPLGVALLARLESRASRPHGYTPIADSSPGRVEAALAFVEAMSYGEFVKLVTYSAVIDVGPWIVDAPLTAAVAYRDAPERAPIAVAIAERFGEALRGGLDVNVQQWWTTNGSWSHKLAPLFGDFGHVYGAGQFSWAGLWTVSDPPEIAHAQLLDAWEMEDGPVTRWRLPVRSSARVFEINRPDDWAQLVIEHPRQAASHPEHWELPGRNQDPVSLSALMGTRGQRAARTSIRSHLVPDWRSVAEHYDGVHLTWAGLITTEGCVTDLGEGDVAMMRYWSSERTHWLADVFDDPEPLSSPFLSAETPPARILSTLDARNEAPRRHRDRVALDQLLGHRPVAG